MSALAKENQMHPVTNPMVMSLSQVTPTPHSITPTVSQDGSMIQSGHLPDSGVVDHGDINISMADNSQEVSI